MTCDTRVLEGQTLTERKEQVRKAVDQLSKGLAAGRIKPKIGPQGGIAFEGFGDNERGAISDACAYRLLMIHGSSLAKAKITLAEHMSGKQVSKQAVAQGWHYHPGSGWHAGHKK